MVNPDQINTKNKSVKNLVVSILGSEWPLSIRKIYNRVKEQGLNVTYQAVFKTVKELARQDILAKKGKAYSINIEWLLKIHEEVENILYKCINKSSEDISKSLYFSDPRIFRFVEEVGPKVKEYLGNDPCCIATISGGGGVWFGLELKRYLEKNGKKVSFVELGREKFRFYKRDVEGRKLIVIDSSVHTGTIFRRAMKKIKPLMKRFGIKDVKYATGYDAVGLADWSCSYIPKLGNIDSMRLLDRR